MSVFRKFSKNDILLTKIHSKPRVNIAYTQNGWVGNTGVSGSLSLYGGVRSRSDVKQSDIVTSGISIYPIDPVETHSIDKVIFVSGSYPSTGTINIVDCDNENVNKFLVTQTQWHSEHYRPIELLFDYHSQFNNNYFLGNYDSYSVLFAGDTSSVDRRGSVFVFSGTLSGTNVIQAGSSFTVETWYKPYDMSNSKTHTIACQRGIWSLRVDQNYDVSLCIDDPENWNTTTGARITPGVWNHIAVVVYGATTLYYVNGQRADSTLITWPAIPAGADSVPLIVGGLNRAVSGSSYMEDSAEGFIYETKIWKRALTESEIAASYKNMLIDSSSQDLVHYSRFNDGPYATNHGYAMGSGAFDYSSRQKHGYILPYYTIAWQPNDNFDFKTVYKKVNEGNERLKVIHIPSMYYGNKIDPGSVIIKDGTYNEFGIVRTFVDDGIGGLYLSGSMLSDVTGEQYKGDSFAKVGNVFYSEGLIVFTDPALLDIFNTASFHWDPTPAVGVFSDLISIEFSGQTRTDTKIFNCRAQASQINASNNRTFSYVDSRGTEEKEDDRTLRIREDGTTYITAVGLYNQDKKLVAVAKLAQPVRKREKDRINIRLKMDF